MSREHAEAISELTTGYETRIESLIDSHAAEMAAAEERRRTEVTALDDRIAVLCDTVSRQKREIQAAADQFAAEKADLLAKNDDLLNEKRVANANIYLLRNEQGRENEDFTSQLAFDELERTYHAFTRFYKEQWRLTKKAIRKDLLRSKGTGENGGAGES